MAKKYVYVVEDDELTSSLLCTMLKKRPDHVVTAFDNGTEAFDACRKQFPDILIIDYQLPGMSGIELFESIKQEIPPTTLVIMQSAIDDGTMVLKFIQQGIRNYVIKDENFIQSIEEILDEGKNG